MGGAGGGNRKRALGLAFSLGLGLAAHDPEPRFTFSGFGTLGLAATDTHQAGYIRDLSQPAPGVTDHPNARMDTRLGLQLDARFSETLRGAVQVLSKERWDGTFKPELSMAFLAWNPAGDLEVRAGRLPMHSVLGTESRDVGYSHLWVRPNVDAMGRMNITRFDGLDMTQTIRLGAGTTLLLKGYGGFNYEKLPIAGGAPIDQSGTVVVGALAEVIWGPWHARLTYDRLHTRLGWPSPISLIPSTLEAYAALLSDPGLVATARSLDLKDGHTRFVSLAGSYERGPIQSIFSLGRLRSDRPLSPDSWSGYWTLGYRVGTVVPYATFSRIVTARPAMPYLGALPYLTDPYAPVLVAGIADLRYHAASDQHTLSGGLRWDFAEGADLKFQVDRVQAHNSVAGWQNPQPGWNGRGTVFTVTLDFVFGRGR